MRQKLFTLLLAIVASAGILFASDTQINGIWYILDDANQTASVTYQGSYYYSYSDEYTGSVVIPASVIYNEVTYSVSSIGNEAFNSCSGLTSVTIPSSVTSIEPGAFDGCSGLTSVTIPNSVTTIGSRTFNSCSGLTSVTIPNSVTSIGNSAFYSCSSLTSIEIPNRVTSLGDNAFRNCSSLTSIEIPNSVTSIKYGTFYNCSGLTSVTIPNSIVSIGNSAFYSCNSLTSIEIPNSILNIGDDAFRNCSGLTSVTVGNGVTSIRYNAFDGCSSLTSVYISDLAAWCAISFCGYESNPLYYAQNLYLNEVLVTDLVIPEGVTGIGNWAFYHCNCLVSVTIPNSVTSIGGMAFDGCGSLDSIVFESETPAIIETNAFTGTNNCPLIVPCSTVDAYKAAWPDYADRITCSDTHDSTVLLDPQSCAVSLTTKFLRNGQILILRGDKTYTLQGQEVK